MSETKILEPQGAAQVLLPGLGLQDAPVQTPQRNQGYSCPICHRSWTTLKMEHCRVCHETFSGTGAGDRHRTGKHEVFEGPERRRCRSAEEMVEVGLAQKRNGVWGYASPDEKIRWWEPGE